MYYNDESWRAGASAMCFDGIAALWETNSESRRFTQHAQGKVPAVPANPGRLTSPSRDFLQHLKLRCAEDDLERALYGLAVALA